ncbi:MAG: CHAT domain-containing protein [Phycisphaerales bacterium]
MSDSPRRPSLLEGWSGMSGDARRASVRAAADPGAVVGRAIDEHEALVHRDPVAAGDAGDWLVGLVDELGDGDARARVRVSVSNALSVEGRLSDAIALLDEVDGFRGDVGDAVIGARVWLARVQPLVRSGRSDEAIEAGRRAAEAFGACGSDGWAARARSNLGVVLRMVGDQAGALKEFDAALAGFEDEPVARAQIQSNRGEALLELARFEEAEAAFVAARDAFGQAGLDRAGALAEGNLADLWARRGRPHAALSGFESALRLVERSASPADRARLLAERAEVLVDIGVLDEALDSFEACVATLDASGLAVDAARARLGIGDVLMRQRRFGDAQRVLALARRAFDGAGNAQGSARAGVGLGRSLQAAGDFAGAAGVLEEAVPALRSLPVEHGCAMLALLDARFRSAGGRISPGVGVAGSLVSEVDGLILGAREMGLALLLGEALHLRGEVAEALGDHGGALVWFAEAAGHVDTTRGLLQAERLRSAWSGRRAVVFESLLRAALRAPGEEAVAIAFDAVERSKARSLLDLLEGGVELLEDLSGGTAGGDAESRRMAGELARLRGEMNALYRWWDERASRGERGVGSLESEERLVSLRRRVEDLEVRLASTRRFGELAGRPATLDMVRASLGEGAGLVEFFVADDRFGAFVLDRNRVETVVDLGSRRAVAEAASRVSFQIDRALADHRLLSEGMAMRSRERRVEQCVGALHGLWSMLAPAFERALDRCELVSVIPHGVLHGVPMHALHDGRGFLIERAAIAYAPSASVLLRAGEPAPSDGAGFVLGVRDDGAPLMREEAMRVAGLRGVDAVVDDRATRGALLGASGASWLHLACHGVFPARDPLGARLRLADGWVSAREVYGLRLDGASVTLSSCDVGRSASNAGEEPYGLVRALLAAGASSVIASLWSAHDRTTIGLMEAMHRRLSGSGSRSVGLALGALRAAQLETMSDNPHPAFWAPFALVGRP